MRTNYKLLAEKYDMVRTAEGSFSDYIKSLQSGSTPAQKAADAAAQKAIGQVKNVAGKTADTVKGAASAAGSAVGKAADDFAMSPGVQRALGHINDLKNPKMYPKLAKYLRKLSPNPWQPPTQNKDINVPDTATPQPQTNQPQQGTITPYTPKNIAPVNPRTVRPKLKLKTKDNISPADASLNSSELE